MKTKGLTLRLSEKAKRVLTAICRNTEHDRAELLKRYAIWGEIIAPNQKTPEMGIPYYIAILALAMGADPHDIYQIASPRLQFKDGMLYFKPRKQRPLGKTLSWNTTEEDRAVLKRLSESIYDLRVTEWHAEHLALVLNGFVRNLPSSSPVVISQIVLIPYTIYDKKTFPIIPMSKIKGYRATRQTPSLIL